MDIRLEQPLCGVGPQMLRYTAGGTVTEGDIVEIGDGNTVIKCVTDTAVDFAGIAQNDATTGDEVMVLPILGNHIYSILLPTNADSGESLAFDYTSTTQSFVVSAVSLGTTCANVVRESTTRAYIVFTKGFFIGGPDLGT
jgi:hypothetical protein